MYKTKITKQGTISLPVVLRRKYNLQPGDELAIEDTGKIIVTKVQDLHTLREKNRMFIKRVPPYSAGDGFTAHVLEKYGK